MDQKRLERDTADEAKKLDRWKQISDAYATQLNAEKNQDKVRDPRAITDRSPTRWP